jgi:hypothetical protein
MSRGPNDSHFGEQKWRVMMRQSTGLIGYDFNTQRMMRHDASEAYPP